MGIKNSKIKILSQLFMTNFMISLCTFGGGYVIAGFMKDKFVDKLHWIDQEEMLDMIAIAQSAPGAIAVDTAVLVGWKVAGFWGMIISTLGTILPPMIVLSIISLFYQAFIKNNMAKALMKGMEAGVCAVILSAVIDLIKPWKKSAVSIGIFVSAIILAFVFRVNVIYIVIGGILVGLVNSYAS